MCLAIPGKIESIDNPTALARTGTVSFGGIRKVVNLSFVPAAGVGHYVIVHAGFAINQLDEEQARRTLDLLAADPDEP